MAKIAVVQEPPVYLNLGKSMDRAVDLIADAAGKGCALIVFPEAWLAGYPTFVWRLAPGSGMGKTDQLYARLLANSEPKQRGAWTPAGCRQRAWRCCCGGLSGGGWLGKREHDLQQLRNH